MRLNTDKWKAALLKAIADMPSQKPTAGIPCAVATIRLIRDGLVDDIGGNNPKLMEDADVQAQCATIRDGCNELIQHICGTLDKNNMPSLNGFASNASAAGAFVGAKGKTAVPIELKE